MKFKCTLLLLGISLGTMAQNTWPTGTTAGSIYYPGNVGVGTNAPATKLHVTDGRIRVENPTESSIQFKTNTSAPTQFWDVGASLYGFYLYESESQTYKFNVTKSGNVGINTTAPQTKLHVNGGVVRIENPTESSIQFRTNTSVPAQLWDVGTNVYGFYVYESQSQTYKFNVGKNGNVGIGVLNADSKLTVNGDIHAKEVRVDVDVDGPDYVFEEDYKLPSLSDVHAYVKQHKHLPEVPSAKTMKEEGIELKEMNLLLLKKVEELTLHAISQEQKIEVLEKALKVLEEKVK